MAAISVESPSRAIVEAGLRDSGCGGPSSAVQEHVPDEAPAPKLNGHGRAEPLALHATGCAYNNTVIIHKE